MVFLLHNAGRSLQREIDSFFEALGYSESEPPLTKGAISRARSALNHLAYILLNDQNNRLFYESGKATLWMGFRVKAFDGSTIVLPESHCSVAEAFPAHGFGPKGDSLRCVARISIAYDVLNGLVNDGRIGAYSTDEMSMAQQHLESCTKGDLVLLDRYYSGYKLFADMLSRGVEFCCRMQTGWWLEVRKLMASRAKDCLVNFQLPKKHHAGTSNITLRLVKIRDKDGKHRVFCTSLLDQKKYSRKKISQLYALRWRIEEGFKTLKNRLRLDQFSGTTLQAVLQDYYAKLMLISLCSILTFGLNPLIQRRNKNQIPAKRIAKINLTYALSRLKRILVQLMSDLLHELLYGFLQRVQQFWEASRQGQNVPRKFRSKTCKMNYKNL